MGLARVATVLCLTPWLLSGIAVRRPVGPTPSLIPSTPRGAAACAGCHAHEVAAWRGSLHARAWRDPIFLAAYQEEPMAFCRGCHAPLGDPAHEPDAVARAEGVSCVSCHADAARHAAAHGRVAADSDDPAPRCAGCHQFNFPVDRGPNRPLWHTSNPMQDTEGEWRRSESFARGEGCVDCHLPAGDHGMLTVERPAVLASAVAVRVRACREGRRWRVEATVGARHVGHAVPTGDLMRQLRLVVSVDGDEATRVFARRFEDVPLTDERGEVHLARRERYDGRLAPPGPDAIDTVTLYVAAPTAALPRWRVEHWRTSPEVAARQHLPLATVRTLIVEGSSLPCEAH
jgi:hypothetical protein